MNCPYCTVNIHPVPASRGGFPGANQMWYTGDDHVRHRIEEVSCPACHRTFLTHSDQTFGEAERGESSVRESNVYVLLPRVSSRPTAPPEVPKAYADLYNEAALILTDSPRASAAMSRRCLQQLLRDVANAPHSDLVHEIDWALNNAGLPTYASESLHELRRIGNFGVHPNKSTATGDYLEVEPGEADWGLETLDGLFDHYFVKPAHTAAKKAALQAKLTP